MSTTESHSPLNISATVRDRGLAPKDHQLKMAYGYQLVTWPMTSPPQKVKLVTSIRLEQNISKAAGDST